MVRCRKAYIFLSDLDRQSLVTSASLAAFGNHFSVEVIQLVESTLPEELISDLFKRKNQHLNAFAMISSLRQLSINLLKVVDVVVVDLREHYEWGVFSFIHRTLGLETFRRYCMDNLKEVIDYDRIKGYQVPACMCSLITSVYMGDPYIQGFFENCSGLTGYSNMEHIVIVSVLSSIELRVLFNWFESYTNAFILWQKNDPGLYPCWNLGIKLSSSEYISNANIDDLRDSSHVASLVELLDKKPHVQFAASACYPFETYSTHLASHQRGPLWYANEGGVISLKNLASFKNSNRGPNLISHNLPHCMPVWRKSLHESCGFFDEDRYGTFADWAFWLRVTASGGQGELLPKGLGYYFVNPKSHNRRGNKLAEWHKKIESEFIPFFLPEGDPKRETVDTRGMKFRLDSFAARYGSHRNDFNRLVLTLEPLCHAEGPIRFIPFIEKYFIWGDDAGEINSWRPKPLTEEWVGILHVPFDTPSWFNPENRPERFLKTQLWKESLKSCRGIITLSEDLSRDLRYVYPQLPVFSTKHPTELEVNEFEFGRYLAEKKVVQVGDWLRKLSTIYDVCAQDHQKIILLKRQTKHYLKLESKRFGYKENGSVTEYFMVSNETYDILLSSSVVVCLLYATVANNVVIECIARKTPLIINPLPSVIEYLGEDYPLYASTVEKVNSLLGDEEKIKSAHDYLNNHKTLREGLSYDNFLLSIKESDFYEGL